MSFNFNQFYMEEGDELNIENKQVSNTDLPELIDFLQRHPHIKRLNLSKNKLSNDGVIATLCPYLNSADGQHITYLDISCNNIDIDGVLTLSAIKQLDHLDMSGNKGVEYSMFGQKLLKEFIKTTYGYKDVGGFCAGVAIHTALILADRTRYRDIIYFDILLKFMYEMFSVLVSKEGATFEEFQPKFQLEFLNQYSGCSEKEQKIIQEILDDFLRGIVNKQEFQQTEDERIHLSNDAEEKGVNGSVTQLFSNQVFSSQKELVLFLERLKRRSITQSKFFSLELSFSGSARGHAVCVGFNATFQEWTYVDANCLPVKYYKTAEGIADAIDKSRMLLGRKSINEDPIKISVTGFSEEHSHERSERKSLFQPWRNKKISERRLFRTLSPILTGFLFAASVIACCLASGVVLPIVGIAAVAGFLGGALFGASVSAAFCLYLKSDRKGELIKHQNNIIPVLSKKSREKEPSLANANALKMSQGQGGKPNSSFSPVLNKFSLFLRAESVAQPRNQQSHSATLRGKMVR